MKRRKKKREKENNKVKFFTKLLKGRAKLK